MTLPSFPPPARVAEQDSSSPFIHRPSIAVIGLGRVGPVLSRALHAAGYAIVAVSSRDSRKAAMIAAAVGAAAMSPRDAVRAADLVLLTISDDALGLVARELAAAGAWQPGRYVVHASGASPASVLSPAAAAGAQVGAFHPLAAIATPDMSLPPGLAFGIEAELPLWDMLRDMALALDGQPLRLAPDDKTLYHAAAVIASNYTVTLAALATQLLERLGATPEHSLHALLPLMRTTLDNLERQGLPDALTGPLIRGDVGTVQRHLRALDQAAPNVAALYRCLAHGTLPLAQQRGLNAAASGVLQDTITLPGELVLEHEA